MIKILTLIMILASGNVFAEEPSPFEGRHAIKPSVYTECRAGKLFVIAASVYGLSIMQIFEDTNDMVPKPMGCECSKEDLRENKKHD